MAVSALLHLVLWPVGDRVVSLGTERTLPPSDGVIEVSLQPDETLQPEETPEPEPELPSDGKVVQLDRLLDERPPEDETDNVSEFDSRVDRPTRAPRRRPTPPGAPRGSRSDSDTDSTREPAERSGGEPPPKDGLALPLGGRKSAGTEDSQAAAADSESRSETPADHPGDGGDARSLSPRGLRGVPEAVRKQWGTPGTFDDVDADEGDETLLNSRRWKYASFFNRLRNDIAQYWDPVPLLQARDPDGRKNGTRTRRTRLMIILNKDGSLHKVRLDRSSDVDYLDEEAIRAVRSAAPFPNPPAGMLNPKDDRLHVPFGFIVEMDGRKRIHRYKK